MSLRSLQERLESSETGRAVVSAFILVTLFAVVTQNLPRSGFQDAAAEVSQPYSDLFGVSQSWSVFAPDPPRTSYLVYYGVDGKRVDPPRARGFLANYHAYRWRKWFERSRRRGGALWPETAAWIRRDLRATRVEIVQRERAVSPPGSPAEPRPKEKVVYP